MTSEEQSILAAIGQVVDVGGSAALLFCAYFINRASERLARIEKALAKYMEDNVK